MTANDAMQQALDTQGYIVIGTFNEYHVGYVSHTRLFHDDGSELEHHGLKVVAPATAEDLLQQYERFIAPILGPSMTDPAAWTAYWKVIAE